MRPFLWQELNVWKQYEVDGFLIVYSITDRRSFQKAVDLLAEINLHEVSQPPAVVLVANKSDLVRSRTVGEDGKDTITAVACEKASEKDLF